jgi:hypothetical protein
MSRLYHSHYGFLTMIADSTWTTNAGERYGTFIDNQRLYVNLPLSEVSVFIV